jgi:hypothetical protein
MDSGFDYTFYRLPRKPPVMPRGRAMPDVKCPICKELLPTYRTANQKVHAGACRKEWAKQHGLSR